MRACVFGAVCVFCLIAVGQNIDSAKLVYDSSQNSVFLLYLNDSSGSPTALGSGFLVGPRLLATNAHVVSGGNPVLAVGPVRIPLTVLRVDSHNDLALLTLDADLSTKPLVLSAAPVSPGEQVFAIGNPEGLEKTISQGIVSGLRKTENRDLIQITSPISHGSSGGPILNAKAEVVGIAVGILENGQNLNFAIPVAYLRTLIATKDSPIEPKPGASLADLEKLLDDRSKVEYSTDPNSDYARTSQKIKQGMAAIEQSSVRQEELSGVACIGTKDIDFSDIGIAAARKLNERYPSAGHQALLSYLLLDRARDEDFAYFVAEKDSPAEIAAKEASQRYYADAEREATNSRRLAKGSDYLLASFVLGTAKRNAGDYSDAVLEQAPVASSNLTVCDIDLVQQAFRNLIDSSDKQRKVEEAEKWFRLFAQRYSPSDSDWDSEGDRRAAQKDYAVAADAYERAAGASEYYRYDYCTASIDRYLQATTDENLVLADGRNCVDASAKNSNKSAVQQYSRILPLVYQDMAEVLLSRGALPSALEYAKEAIAGDPQSPFSLYTESKVLEKMDHFSECTAAAQEAVRLSDGAYPYMQFQLGSCYFDSGNWSQAAESFRVAALADKTDAPAAFNLGLSLERQGFGADARQWYREALSRNPDSELRGKIQSVLR